MHGAQKLVSIIALAGWGFFAPAGPVMATEDEWLGLPAGEGREEVFYGCQACHSLKTVTQQGLNRSSWKEILVWMVEEQEMDPLEPKDKELILGYLSKFYGRERLAAKMASK